MHLHEAPWRSPNSLLVRSAPGHLWKVRILHLCGVDQLVRPSPGWGNGSAVNTTGQAALVDDLEGRVGGGAERINVGYVGLEVVCIRLMVLLHFSLSCFLR